MSDFDLLVVGARFIVAILNGIAGITRRGIFHTVKFGFIIGLVIQFLNHCSMTRDSP